MTDMAPYFGAVLQHLDWALVTGVIGVSTQTFDGRLSEAP